MTAINLTKAEIRHVLCLLDVDKERDESLWGKTRKMICHSEAEYWARHYRIVAKLNSSVQEARDA